LLPRINLKREAWPGGPQVGDVIQAQLSPRSVATSGPQLAGSTDQAPSDQGIVVDLLLLLR
jgi:hypothetical protein